VTVNIPQEVMTVYDVLRNLIDAVFRTGGITDTSHAALHQAVNEADPAAAEAKRQADAELTPAETAELERLQAKQQAAGGAEPQQDQAPANTAAAPAAPGFGPQSVNG
jgi:uncharacterized membrane protein